MSQVTQQEQQRRRLRIRPPEAQVIMSLFAALIGFFALRISDYGLGPVLVVMALFAIGLAANRAWAIWLAIGTLIWLKYSFNFELDLTKLQISDVYVCLLLVLVSAASFRVLEAARFLDTWYPGLKLRRSIETRQFEFPSLLGGRWWVIPMAVILAVFLLGIFPFGQNAIASKVGIKPLAARVISLTLTLFFAWFICSSLVDMVVRWRMKPEQADVQCRSMVANELWKDVYNFERRRAKVLDKKNRPS